MTNLTIRRPDNVTSIGDIADFPESLDSADDYGQTTLLRPISCVGVGLHSGAKVHLSLLPAEADTGVLFRRTDIETDNEIQGRWDNVVETTMCTTLGNDSGVRIGTVEHLMAALSGCHIDNAIVEVSGPEIPIMDGSSQPFVFLLECAGIKHLAAPKRVVKILKPIRVDDGDSFAELIPDDEFSVGFEIDFDRTVVANQEISVSLVNGTFRKEIARARTFGFMEEVEMLRQAGLGLGGSLDNAVIVDGDEILNEGGLRYDDEFVRHKVLDAVGDLFLAGYPIQGHFSGFRSGHALNNRLLRALFDDRDAWCIVDIETADGDMTYDGGSPVEVLAATA
ncbi:MAG: UDP-3-O-acyl-N-acetylglucosamine deacetylase [Proteobacteria bacterium]|nr:UDP-3-O-acyl-N-acetylglucosamine deacetylase [Pseudomonadota bacterium]